MTFGSCLQNIHCAMLAKELLFPPPRGFQWFCRRRQLEVGSYSRENGFTREALKSFSYRTCAEMRRLCSQGKGARSRAAFCSVSVHPLSFRLGVTRSLTLKFRVTLRLIRAARSSTRTNPPVVRVSPLRIQVIFGRRLLARELGDGATITCRRLQGRD